jgi:hypothetical protein
MSTGPSAADLEAKAKGMKKVATKPAAGGPDKAAVEAMAKVYKDAGGDLGKIASKLGVQFKEGTKVKDANDFATRFLNGTIVKD